MRLEKIIEHLKERFPEHLQESYDNSGIQVLHNDSKLDNILISLDINKQTVELAKHSNSNIIITHHPLIFTALKTVRESHYRQSLIFELIKSNISHYALHTNLDKHYWMKPAQTLGLRNIQLLFPERGLDDIGFGSYGTLSAPLTRKELLAHIKYSFSCEYIQHSTTTRDSFSSVAILNGSGGSSIYSLLDAQKFDCIITGDVKYHEAYEAAEAGVFLVDAGHFYTEKIFCNFLKHEIQDYLTKSNCKAEILINDAEQSPLRLFT